MNGIPPWGSSINVEDEELYEDGLDEYGIEENNVEYHVTLSKPLAHAVGVLTVVGLGTIAYVVGKGIERLLDK